jgi:hypothetical protein
MTNCDICNEPIHRQPHPVEHMINSCSVCGWHSMLDEDEQTQVKSALSQDEVISVIKDLNGLLDALYTHYVTTRPLNDRVGDFMQEVHHILGRLRIPMDSPQVTPLQIDGLILRERRLQSFFSTIKTISTTQDLHSDRYKEMMTAVCEQYLEDAEIKKALEDFV